MTERAPGEDKGRAQGDASICQGLQDCQEITKRQVQGMEQMISQGPQNRTPVGTDKKVWLNNVKAIYLFNIVQVKPKLGLIIFFQIKHLPTDHKLFVGNHLPPKKTQDQFCLPNYLMIINGKENSVLLLQMQCQVCFRTCTYRSPVLFSSQVRTPIGIRCVIFLLNPH